MSLKSSALWFSFLLIASLATNYVIGLTISDYRVMNSDSVSESSKLYDGHVHFFVPFADLDRELQDKVINEFVAVLDENGVDKVLVSNWNVQSDEHIYALYERIPDRIIPFLSSFDPQDPACLDYIREELSKRAWKGLGEIFLRHDHVFEIPANHPNVLKIFDLAAEFDVPVLINFMPSKEEHEQELREALSHNKNTKVISFGCGDCLRLIPEYPNLYHTFVYPSYLPLEDIPEVEEEFQDNVIFGSDLYVKLEGETVIISTPQDPGFKPYPEVISDLRLILSKLPTSMAEKIAYKNIEKIIGTTTPYREENKPDESTYYETIVLLNEDFEDGEPKGWELHEDWSIENEDGNNVLSCGAAVIWIPIDLRRTDWEESIWQLRLKMVDPDVESSVALSFQRGDFGTYVVSLRPYELVFRKEAPLGLNQNVTSTPLALTYGAWHSVRIEMKGNQTNVYVDDSLKLAFTDKDPIPQGGILLEVSGHIHFDDFIITRKIRRFFKLPWTATNGPDGGLINVVAVHPNDSNILFAGGRKGFFKSVNGGQEWEKMDEPRLYEIRGILIDPQNPNRMYIYGERGFWKTEDGGKNWKSVDLPETLPSEFWSSQLVMDPSNNMILYLATVQGIFKTADGGESWTNITDGIGNVNIFSIGVVDSDKIYVGTANSPKDQNRLYYTRDGGESWRPVDIGLPEIRLDSDVVSILVDPYDPDVIYVGFASDSSSPEDRYMLKTMDGGVSWELKKAPREMPGGVLETISSDGVVYILSHHRLYRSFDGGETWEQFYQVQVHPGVTTDLGRGCLTIDPSNPNVMYLSLRGTGIVKSVDGGKTWRYINKGLSNTVMNLVAVHPENPNVVYAASTMGIGTFKTIDGGENWIYLDPGGISHSFADELVIDPVDPNIIYEVSDTALIFKSTDSGETWNIANNGFRFSSIYALAVDPSDSNVVYALKNGFGIFKSENGGHFWTYLQGSPDYTYTIAIDPENPDIIYSGYSRKVFENASRVYRSTDGGYSWEVVLEVPDSRAVMSIVIDPQNPNRVYAGITGERGQIYFSDDKGETWNRLNEHFTMCTVWGQPQLIVDPNNPSVAYAATWLAGTWKTTDAGKTWTLLEDAPISAVSLSIDKRNPDTLYLSDRSSPTVWKSTDGGQTWRQIADFSSDGALLVMRVLVDGDNIYASTFLPALRGGNLYKSTDGGETWRDITGTLPPGILDLAVDPTNSNIVYLTTNIHGAYKSLDGGETWTRMEGFPDVGAYDMEVDPDDPTILYTAARGGSLPSWFTRIAGITEGIKFTDSAGVYMSTDSGKTWKRILKTSVSCRAIRRHPDNPNLLFAPDLIDGLKMSRDGGKTWISLNEGLDNCVPTSIAVSGDKIYIGTQGCGVYSGDLDVENGKVTWQPSRSNKPVPKVYRLQIRIDSKNSNNIFVGSYPGGLYASTNGGKTFRDRNAITPSVVVEDPFIQGYYAFAIDPNNSSKMWIGTWGKGIYKSYNSMILNVPVDLFGKHITQIIVDPKDSNVVYATTTQGVFVTKDEGKTWSEMNDGLLTKDVYTLAIGSDGQLYAGTRGYGVFRFNRIEGKWEQTFQMTGFGLSWHVWDRPMYQYTSLLIDPRNNSIMYLGAFPSGMFKSTDGGKTWKESNIGFFDDGVDGIFSLTFHPHDKSIIYAGTYNGISVTYDAGGHWKRISNGIPPEQWVYSIAIDPTNPDVMYAASKNGKNKGTGEPGFHGTVVKTLDGGENWFEIVKGLDRDNEFYTIIIDPSNSSRLFLCTSGYGVFISLDAGESWSPMNKGLTDYETGTYPPPNVATPLRISRNGAVLYLGTKGSGMFKRFIKPLSIAEAGPDQTVDEDTTVTLDGSGSISNVRIVSYVWTFIDIASKSLRGETVTYNFTNPGKYLIILNVTDALGNSYVDTVMITVNDVTPPVADAGMDQTVKVNIQVNFDATDSSDNVGIVSYEWDFGDGATRTGEQATHTYTKAGTYTVILTVTDAAGHSDTDSVIITVMEEEGFLAWIPAAVIAGMVALVIAVYFIVIRKTS